MVTISLAVFWGMVITPILVVLAYYIWLESDDEP